MKQFSSGAKSSEEAPRYDLLEPEALRRMAARMAQGAASHGPFNYRAGKHDADFRRDRVNHLVGHALALAAGDTSEDHLGAVLANASILAYLDAPGAKISTPDNPPRMTYDERRITAGPCSFCHRRMVMNPCESADMPCPLDGNFTK